MQDIATDTSVAPGLEDKEQHGAAERSLGEYTIGYGKPPKSTQFKEGQSGNPRGRQRKKQAEIADLRLVIEDVLAEPMTVREGGKVRTVTTLEAIWGAQMANALKKPKAFRDLFRKAQKMGLFSVVEPKGTIVITRPGTDDQRRMLDVFHGKTEEERGSRVLGKLA